LLAEYADLGTVALSDRPTRRDPFARPRAALRRTNVWFVIVLQGQLGDPFVT
jgi:hypothetical protein